MGIISLKMPDELLKLGDNYAKLLNISRAAYIRQAIELMNKETLNRLRTERLAEASLKVRKESMKINAEFEALEEDLDV